MSVKGQHADWRSLVDYSGPFLSLNVLTHAFPHGMEAHEPHVRSRFKTAFEEWELDRDEPSIHSSWILFVLEETLEFEGLLWEKQSIPQGLKATVHGETLRPDYIVARAEGRAAELLVMVVAPNQKLDGASLGKRTGSPATRMMELLHHTNHPLGLVSNGGEWMVVWAKPGQTTGYAIWRSDILADEVGLFRAFRSLHQASRFFGVSDDETLKALYERSADDQKEVTDQLGLQVRSAVALLIQTLEWYDRETDRKLLAAFEERQLYEAALTVMMRLVFLLCAEERGLMLLGESDLYDQYYSVSNLRDQLRKTADRHGEEVLNSRYDSWSRLLAIFRAVHSGIAHEDLLIPAYGGTLFDPDRFPFLEGRLPDTHWATAEANPLPVDNRTVLALLEWLQLLEVKAKGQKSFEAQRLSYRALDIEQIGHVYEGLLAHTAARATEPTLALSGTGASSVEVPLSRLESWTALGEERLINELTRLTKRTEKALTKRLGLYEAVPDAQLSMVCDGDEGLVKRVRPYAALLREGPKALPYVLTTDGVYVTYGTDRRVSGAHYTPRGLTEEIVRHALDPLVYRGMADGVAPGPETLKSPEEILALRVCDMAMGSGAFLVQACRYLSEKLVLSWEKRTEGTTGQVCLPYAKAGEDGESLPPTRDERLAVARRLVVERSLYGVDKNPLAVEMAKLSLWLITLDEKKPFTFLDHALRCGDSLLGITDREQLRCFHLAPRDRPPQIFGASLIDTLREAEKIRKELKSFAVREPRDGERKRALLERSEELTGSLKAVADLLIGVYLQSDGKPGEDQLAAIAPLVLHALPDKWESLGQSARERLNAGNPEGQPARRPFHWALEFPEVFEDEGGGFDAVVGNPPFQGGKMISGSLGTDYRDHLIETLALGKRGNADLCAYFLLRLRHLLRRCGTSGLLATNTISEGGTREVGLDQLVRSGFSVYRAVASRKWPGEASLEVAHLWLCKCDWKNSVVLNEEPVSLISTFLTKPGKVQGVPERLSANSGKSFIGSYVLGMGFTMTQEEAHELIALNPRNKDILLPYLNGRDLNSSPTQSASRWIINFQDWPVETAQGYPECWKIIEEKVQPERQRRKPSGEFVLRRPLPERFWHYADKRPALYSAIRGLKRVLVAAEVSKHIALAFRPVGEVFSHMLVVFPTEKAAHLALLQSTIADSWNRSMGSSLETRFRFTPSSCIDTFVFPTNLAILERVGEEYHTHRQTVMLTREEGLTQTYNRFHDPKETSPDIAQLRLLHQNMDQQVALAYGWTDLDLGHDFHETKHGIRYTISEPARLEVLDRLLALNHERYAQEVAEGLHDKKKKKTKKRVKKSTRSKKKKEPVGQGELF